MKNSCLTVTVVWICHPPPLPITSVSERFELPAILPVTDENFTSFPAYTKGSMSASYAPVDTIVHHRRICRWPSNGRAQWRECEQREHPVHCSAWLGAFVAA